MAKPIEATSQTRWRDLPDGWKNCATNAVVDSGHGDTELVVVAVIASALWEYVQTGGDGV